ncbi:MAG: hypothetical protein GX883_07325 [Firmicutes bacterium]|nr:hypothetical protein [Bacillota bacterium]
MPNPAFSAKDERGLTLIEVLVSVTLLVLMSMSFAPALMFVLETSERNRIRTVGTAIANEVIEELRAKTFDEILVGEQEDVRTVDGRDYKVLTMINWMELSGSGAASGDYKEISVSVSLPSNAYASRGTTIILDTKISRDYALPIIDGANIRIQAYRGWTEEEEPDTIQNLKIELVEENGIKHDARTNEHGSALFLGLNEGDYTIHPVLTSVSPNGMITLPGSSFEVYIVEGLTEDIVILAEEPCQLTVNFLNVDGDLLEINGKATLVTPFKDENMEIGETDPTQENWFTFEETISGKSKVVFDGLWPVGVGSPGFENYNLIVEGLKEGTEYYYQLFEDENRSWNGTFDYPGHSRNINVILIEIVDEGEED